MNEYKKLHAVILAGGVGTRLWPESRQSKAKQFLSIESERTMIESTVDRLGQIVPRERIWILTTKMMSKQIESILPDIPASQILTEPAQRNTAPCIGLAAARLLQRFPDAVMTVLPSDHVIRDKGLFCDTLRFAVDLVEEDSERLITLGIKPTFPSTSYGYIERSGQITSNACNKWKSLTNAYNVNRFHEKPPKEKAISFLESGQFAWNGGIFVWKAKTIYDLISRFEPEIGGILGQIVGSFGGADEVGMVENLFLKMKNISIDYAVLERADSIVMLEAKFDWDDVGTWCTLDRLYAGQHDSQGNLALTKKLLSINSSGCIIRANNPNHLFALLGINDVIIIQTEDATLIARKDQEESVRKIIDELKEKGWTEFL
ncbi:MAG: NTP transferase domain-containing protein [Planctomycetaceae bacterium]|jgi:mannose-1-phosphate guanylyltransferase|nr:NTP transferase domain-containing protein [Planctomycetaceae bacterium]